MTWIDSHSHHYLSNLSILSELKEKGLEGIVSASWIPVRPSGETTIHDLFVWVVEVEKARLDRVGIAHYPAIGIHPRCIPPQGLQAALSYVEEFLAQPSVKALGEVGLETGDEIEMEVLELQLRIAKRLDKPAIIHTPRKNKAVITPKVLKLLDRVGIDPSLTVVDHVTSEIADDVRKSGRWMGLTIQPAKLTVEEAVKIAMKYGGSMMMANTDTSTEPSWPQGVYDLEQSLNDIGAKEVARMVVYQNARSFYRL
ncbi:MAG: TatD family hydrolase [Thaumarchaeota archaeon]|nr:TatD family hydrolase [Nitrososphaerota archaeon]